MFPPDGARIESSVNEPVALKIAGGSAPLTIMVNGVPLAENSTMRHTFPCPDPT